MGIGTLIDVDYRVVDGWHIFRAKQMPGLYVANPDPKRAFEQVGPSIAKLMKLDEGIDCVVVPDVSFGEFIGKARADMTSSAQRQRFMVVKEAA